MPDAKPYAWATDSEIAADQIAFAFDFILGRAPLDETEKNTARYIANRYPTPRLELLRFLTSQADFLKENREFLSLLIDFALRRAVFGDIRPPKVNLFCVGAARAGTTWLSKLIALSPHIYSPPVKETNFFSHFSSRATPNGVSDDVYDMYYFGWRDQSVLTDFSPNYLRYRHAMEGISQYNKNSKIIICLRDPVERALSAYFYTASVHKQTDILAFFRKGIETFDMNITSSELWYSARSLLRQGMYFDDVKSAKALFKDVLIFTTDQFGDAGGVFRAVCAFVNVAPDNVAQAETMTSALNVSKRDGDQANSQVKALLEAFYAEDRKRLSEELGIVI